MRTPWVSRAKYQELAEEKDVMESAHAMMQIELRASVERLESERSGLQSQLTQRQEIARATFREKDSLIALSSVLEKQLESSEKRYADLLARFTQLRLMGAQSVELPLGAPAVAPEPDRLVGLIHQLTKNMPGIVRQNALRQLAEDRAAQMAEEKIEARIVDGLDPEGPPT